MRKKVYTIVYQDGYREIQEHEESVEMFYGFYDPSTVRVYNGPYLWFIIKGVRRYRFERYKEEGAAEALVHSPATG